MQLNSGLPEFSRFVDWPKSETSDFGWRDREGACNMIEHFKSPPPQPSPASGGGSRPSVRLAPIHSTEIRSRSGKLPNFASSGDDSGDRRDITLLEPRQRHHRVVAGDPR